MRPKHNTFFFFAALLSVLLALGACSKQAPAPAPPGNIVMIAIDTVRDDTFYSEHIEDALSPWLADAQVYRNTSSVSSWTIPAVATIFTGLYPVQHGAGLFRNQPANLDVDLPSALDESLVSLADILTGAQFRTAAFSAHPWINAKFGLAQGFAQLHPLDGWRAVNGKFYEWLDQLTDSPDDQQRFFGYLHLMEAHDWHLEPLPELETRLAGIEPGLLDLLREDVTSAACANEGFKACKSNQVYNLAVREVRVAIAEVLQNLKERGLLEDTLVVVYSDHGEEFREHYEEHKRRGDPRGFYGIGHGHSMYEEQLHVPLLAWHPGIEGAVRQDSASLLDVMPSVLNWLGVEYPGEPLPGLVLPAGADPTPEAFADRIIYASGIAYGSEMVASREDSLKSILYYPDEDFEYFDLSTDPDEKRPITSDQLTMRFDVLTGDYLDLKVASLTASGEVDQQTLEHLKSIGYLQGVETQAEVAEQSAEQPPSADEETEQESPQEHPQQ